MSKLEKVKRNDIFKKLNIFKKEIESLGHEVIFISLYGSQNYNLDDEFSDVDAHCVVKQTTKNLILKKDIKGKIEKEFGDCTYHDIVSFSRIAQKGNIQFIEAINSSYTIGKVPNFLEKFNVNPMSIYGMMCQKEKALKFPYPSKLEVIERFGYDPKQLHHIFRLHRLLINYTFMQIIPFEMTIYINDECEKEKLINLKRNGNGISSDDVYDYTSPKIAQAKKLCDEMNWSNNNEIDFDYISNNYIIGFNNPIERPVKSENDVTIINEHTIYEIAQFRTFGNDVPKFMKRNLTDETQAKLKGKDASIMITFEIEVYDE